MPASHLPLCHRVRTHWMDAKRNAWMEMNLPHWTFSFSSLFAPPPISHLFPPFFCVSPQPLTYSSRLVISRNLLPANRYVRNSRVGIYYLKQDKRNSNVIPDYCVKMPLLKKKITLLYFVFNIYHGLFWPYCPHCLPDCLPSKWFPFPPSPSSPTASIPFCLCQGYPGGDGKPIFPLWAVALNEAPQPHTASN